MVENRISREKKKEKNKDPKLVLAKRASEQLKINLS